MGSPDGEGFDDERPERDVTVSGYELDKYEVTVGRFRAFVENWTYQGLTPGVGAHPRIGGSGWRGEWNEKLPASRAELESQLDCDGASTWNSGQDTLPINCVTWYDAFAFCAWDGGRLPTEAEWEYAAAGGEENLTYPWGTKEPTHENGLAVYDCAFDGLEGDCSFDDAWVPVGTTHSGAGRWGHQDLAGNMWEWVLDVYSDYETTSCDDCANTADIPIRVLRGGSWSVGAVYLRAADRSNGSPTNKLSNIGFRCSRTPSP